MSFDLTGQKVSFTYGNLVQHIDGSFYNGFGLPIDISITAGASIVYVDAADNYIKGNYVPNASLGTDFFWNAGLLEVSIASGTGDVTKAYVDASLILRIAEASLNMTKFTWSGGLLEPSVAGSGGVSQAYVDGSLNDIRANYVPNASLGAESFYYDASNYLQTSGGGGGSTIFGKWKYDNATGDSDPGSGEFRLNNVDPSLATYVYISNETVAKANVKNILLLLKQGDVFYVQKLPDPTEYCIYTLTGDASEAVNYVKLPVISSSASGSTFTDKKEFGFIFLYSGRSQYVTQQYVNENFIKKYSESFDPTGISTYSVDASTHNLGSDYAVFLYEGFNPVYVNTSVDGVGNLTLSWPTGSVTDIVRILLFGYNNFATSTSLDSSLFHPLGGNLLIDFKANVLELNSSINMRNNRIINLSTPVDTSDAVNKYYVDSSLLLYVKKSGDTMSGNLTVNSSLFVYGKIGVGKTPSTTLDVSGTFNASGNATFSTMFANIGQINTIYPQSESDLTISTRSTGVGRRITFGGNAGAATNRWGAWKYTDSSIGWFGIGTIDPSYALDVSGNVHFSGSTIIDGSILLKSQKISGLSIPTDTSDAVNKFYVDSSFSLSAEVDSSLAQVYSRIDASLLAIYARMADIEAFALAGIVL
jgi:hypothetical protein